MIHSYTSALQTLAIFGLGLNRFPALLGVVVFTGLCVFPTRMQYVLTRSSGPVVS